MSKERMSNFELLRIIAMVGIVFFHYSDHGCANITLSNSLESNYVFQSLFRIGGGIGNCIFVLLTGYFMINSKITLSKVLRLWFQVLFYSLFSLLIYLAVSGNYRSSLIGYSLFPITHNVYWFFTTYMVLFLCTPLINAGIKSLTNRSLLLTTALLFSCFSLMPTLGNYTFIDNNRLGVFVTLYLMGAWFRIYGCYLWDVKRINFISLVVALIFISLSEWSILTNGWGSGVQSRYRYVWGMEQALVVVASYALFIYFATVSIKSNRLINVIAGTVFGVYLIHMNPLTTNYIWYDVFGIQDWFKNDLMPLYWLLTGLLLFVSCSFIEFMRIKFIEKYTNNYINSSSFLKEVENFFTKKRVVKS